MKKVIILLIISLLSTSISAHSKTTYDTYTLECIETLNKYNIVSAPAERWAKDDYIKRRDVFDISAYVKEGEPYHFYYESFSNRAPSEVKSMLEDYFRVKFEFSDIEIGSDDFNFVAALFCIELIKGSNSENGTLARLDDDTTYNEAFTILGRMFTKIGYFSETEIIKNYESEYPFYDYLADIKIINSKNPAAPYCPQISIDELSDKITAYEFLTLLQRALYVPSFARGDYAPFSRHYFIDDFVKKQE